MDQTTACRKHAGSQYRPASVRIAVVAGRKIEPCESAVTRSCTQYRDYSGDEYPIKGSGAADLRERCAKTANGVGPRRIGADQNAQRS